MKLTFLGTRGEIDARTRRHRMHASLLVSHRGARVMIDCGLDWLGKLKRVDPNAIVLTHAHPDQRLGIETRCAVSGVCAGKNVAGIEALPDR
jgi:ribonuclease BN (tRNA processing enzyme)